MLIKKEEHQKKVKNRTLVVGALAAVVGVFATSPNMVANNESLQIGLYSTLVAVFCVGIVLWILAEHVDI